MAVVQDNMTRQLRELEKQVDAKMVELDETSTKNVQLGARVRFNISTVFIISLAVAAATQDRICAGNVECFLERIRTAKSIA